MEAIEIKTVQSKRIRLDSVDVLRGFVMVLMVLDHVRSHWMHVSFNALDLDYTTIGLFMTRWITHLCAPIFVFLAGVGVFLSQANGKSKKELTQYLVTRGLLLIAIEVLIMSKFFTLSLRFIPLQVIWVMGCGMLVLAVCLWLPRHFLWIFSLGTIAGHNLLDGFVVENAKGLNLIWVILHQGDMKFDLFAGIQCNVGYPLIPWTGVMILGYLLGDILLLERKVRIRKLIRYGSMMVVGFLILRGLNFYGDPQPWSVQSTWMLTVLSFINCEKYPPSLLFILMTLGPGLILLGVLEAQYIKFTTFFKSFGRVPLFFYLIHMPIITLLAMFVGMSNGMNFKEVASGKIVQDLLPVYGVWALVVLLLYPLSVWYMHLKKTKSWTWLKYI